jgi:hypothetical protein
MLHNPHVPRSSASARLARAHARAQAHCNRCVSPRQRFVVTGILVKIGRRHPAELASTRFGQKPPARAYAYARPLRCQLWQHPVNWGYGRPVRQTRRNLALVWAARGARAVGR